LLCAEGGDPVGGQRRVPLAEEVGELSKNAVQGK
jgi:hypothetical protein